MKRKYYVYRHRTTTDGRVFYVGCGDKMRPYHTYKGSRSKDWLEIYENEGLIVEILHITEDKDEALELEALIIQEYGRICDGGNLVNKATFKSGIKGDKHPFFGKKFSFETRQKLSQLRKGKIPSNSKAVLQYSKDGEFIKEYISVRSASKELNLKYHSGILKACNGLRKTSSGFIWRFKEE